MIPWQVWTTWIVDLAQLQHHQSWPALPCHVWLSFFQWCCPKQYQCLLASSRSAMVVHPRCMRSPNIEHILVVMQCCHFSTRGPLREKHVSMVLGKHNDVIGMHIVQEGCHMPYLYTWAAIAEGWRDREGFPCQWPTWCPEAADQSWVANVLRPKWWPHYLCLEHQLEAPLVPTLPVAMKGCKWWVSYCLREGVVRTSCVQETADFHKPILRQARDCLAHPNRLVITLMELLVSTSKGMTAMVIGTARCCRSGNQTSCTKRNRDPMSKGPA